MLRTSAALVALALTAAPVFADEVTDTLEGALEAYRAGDMNAAREDIDYAAKLLAAMRAESLAKLLPAALPGWTREDAQDDESAGMMAMFGGGTAASATYTRDDGTELKIDLVANSPMVSGIAAMVSGMGSMGGSKPMRIKRTEFIDSDGDLQGVVEGKVMISASGDASPDQKKAYLEAMDLDALADF
jgi:hypothetical protein